MTRLMTFLRDAAILAEGRAGLGDFVTLGEAALGKAPAGGLISLREHGGPVKEKD